MYRSLPASILSLLSLPGLIGLIWGWLLPEMATAQVVRDRTLPQPTQVTAQGNIQEITGGSQAGRNLFHSFDRFSVPEGQTAFFNQPNSIENIFSRVTGESVSRIDGELRANGSANLFLLNPNGIVFGPNASLNIGGSFVGSTANSLRFADGAEFSAVNPQASPLLTVSVPVGLQFGANSGSRSGSIQVRGSGHALFLNSPEDPSVNRSNRPTGLAVNSGQMLALVGGDVSLAGGNLTARRGRIELGSVTAGQVTLIPVTGGWRLGYEAASAFRDITLTQAASLEASGNRGGEIQLQGRAIRIAEASALLADTLGTRAGGSLTLRATEDIQVTGSTVSSSGPFVSRLSTDVAPGAGGQGGRITVVSPQLQIDSGGQVSSGTFGAGNAGSLQVEATDVLISGGSLVGPSGLFVPVAAGASGNGGTLILLADRLRITNRAQISATTFGTGNAGVLRIEADVVELRNSGLFAIVEQGASGDGNNLSLVANQLSITNGAQITTSTFGTGDAGALTVRTSQIELVGGADSFASGILASVESGATGSGGNLSVTTHRLQIRNGGVISTTTSGSGKAGNLSIRAEELEIRGGSVIAPSALFTTAVADGDGGNLTIDTQRLQVADGGQIATTTFGNGNAGTLTINALESVELVGSNRFGDSGLFANALGTGDGGDLRVVADQLTVQDGAIVSISNIPSRGSGRGSGAVGNLTLIADQIVLNRGGQLTADSAAGDRGNIRLESNNLLLRQQSTITTNAQGEARGGNITIETGLLAASGNSDITANAEANFGGQVTITAESVFGTQVRSQPTPESDITASSALGARFEGTIQVNTQEIDPSQGLVQLPDRLVDASTQVAAVCEETEGNEFVVTGRGGLPEAPIQLLRGETIWEDLQYGQLNYNQNNYPSDQADELEIDLTPQTSEIVEAQGWRIDQNGQVKLVAEANVEPQIVNGCLEKIEDENGS